MDISKALVVALGGSALALAAPASAATVMDSAGDFLTTFAGRQNGDLDILSIGARLRGPNLILSATLAGDIGTTPDALYVWGIDRGRGTARFVGATPSVGAGVLFDSVLILRPDGTGSFIDLLRNSNNFALPAGSILINGANIKATMRIAAIPSTGFDDANFGYNLWPRVGIPGTAGISDFAPDASVIKATIPEPASWALMVAGFALAGGAVRRTRSLPA